MKKLLSCVLILVMAVSLAACGNSNSPAPSGGDKPGTSQQADTPTDPEKTADADPGAELSAWAQTKTGKFYSQFADGMYMEYEMEYDGSRMTVITASRGDKTYSETKADGQSAGASIMDGEYLYAIDHAAKTVVKMSLQTSGQEVLNTMIEEGDVDPLSVVSGTREIDGKSYDTEEWSIDDAKSILCFDGDALAYMIGEFAGEETVIKVIKTSDQVDDSLFEIPADYQVVSY